MPSPSRTRRIPPSAMLANLLFAFLIAGVILSVGWLILQALAQTLDDR